MFFFACNVFNASIVLRPTDPAVTAVTEVKAILIGPGGENPDPFGDSIGSRDQYSDAKHGLPAEIFWV